MKAAEESTTSTETDVEQKKTAFRRIYERLMAAQGITKELESFGGTDPADVAFAATLLIHDAQQTLVEQFEAFGFESARDAERYPCGEAEVARD